MPASLREHAQMVRALRALRQAGMPALEEAGLIPVQSLYCVRSGRQGCLRSRQSRWSQSAIVKGLNCSYDKDALEIVRRYKFTPAMKDGQTVSQAIQVEFEYRRIL